jgi:NAD/NADP transhydrogenase beta subunit
MSILQSISDFAAGKHRSTGPRSMNANDAVLRATGVVSLLAIGAIHFLQIVPTTEQTPLLGVSFLFLIAACVAVAARLATHRDQRTWIASAIVCAAAIGGYVFTRIFSTPLDNQDVGNWSCMLGLAALFVETTLLAFSAYAALTHRAAQTIVRQARTSRESSRIIPRNSSAA